MNNDFLSDLSSSQVCLFHVFHFSMNNYFLKSITSQDCSLQGSAEADSTEGVLLC